jgi:hypothetical protein
MLEVFENKLSYVEDIASESSIICVTESHLDTNIIDNDIIIDGFSDQILRKDRNCFGGGVLVYTSQDICVKPRQILICTVYRPPGSVAAFWENFEYSIEQAMNYTSNIIINGDLNVDLLRENNNKLLEIISAFNLTNVIKEPTRNGALLDPFLVSNLDIKHANPRETRSGRGVFFSEGRKMLHSAAFWI